MKLCLITILILCMFNTIFAQDTAKFNNNLLLDYYKLNATIKQLII